MTTIGSLFSGIGGLDLAVESFFNAETVWHCELDPEPSKVLAARWPGVPNLGDITKVDWAAVEPVDILCGGFPCQDLSLAGRRKGIRPGTRSGLWADFKTAIAALRPSVVVIENVRGMLSGCAESDSDVEPCPGCVGDGEHRPLVRALGRVLGDLASLGFDAEWGSIHASDVGAPHGRFRVFVVAYARGVRLEPWGDAGSGEAAGGRSSAVVGGRGGAHLTLLPTPTASEGEKGGPGQRHGSGDATLSGLAGWLAPRLLPTPQVADAEGGHARRGGERGDELLLPGLAEHATAGLLPTPRASRGASSTEIMYALGGERDDEGDRQGNVTGAVGWGVYEPAIRRWEALTRPAPAPTRADGKNGRDRLNPELPEWMMGYPAGWITDVIGRDAAIKAAGNGVCPQQAYAALEQLWGRVESLGVAA